MIIKVILITFAYLLIGIAFLEVELWAYRKTGNQFYWVDYRDNLEQVTFVILWPFMLLPILMYILYIGLVHLIKGIRIFFTTIVYLIAALIDKPSKKLSVPEGWIKDKPPAENNYYLVYEKIEDDSNIICVEQYKDGEWINLDPGQEVIAWMPSPEGYKAGKE